MFRIWWDGATSHPTAEWISQQLLHAFPYDSAPRYIIRDRDCIYGEIVQQRLNELGIQQVLTAPRSPWQSPYVERLIGTIRRDCLDPSVPMIVRHLPRVNLM